MGSDGGYTHRPGGELSPDVDHGPRATEPAFVAGGDHGGDRSWPLTDPMRIVRGERRRAGAQIGRSMRAWRKEAGPRSGNAPIPQSGGAPLPGDVRHRMEGQLGADLSSVKVHTSGEAGTAATALGARAFTVGSDVHFGAGEYAPGTKEGDRLLAHELTHVVQGQSAGVQRKADDGGEPSASADHDVSHPDEPAEKEADAVGDHVAEALHADGDQTVREAAGREACSEGAADRCEA